MSTGRHAARAPRTRTLHGFWPAVSRALRTLVATALIVLLGTLVVAKFVLHLGLSPVLTGSMRPTFAPGDAVITRVVPVTSVHPGSVAVFVPPGESAPFAHRVVTASHTAQGVVVTTKGDANPAPDRWRAVLHSKHVAIVVAHLPKVGYALVAIHQRQWRAALIGLFGLLATFAVTGSVLRRTPPPTRRVVRQVHA